MGGIENAHPAGYADMSILLMWVSNTKNCYKFSAKLIVNNFKTVHLIDL